MFTEIPRPEPSAFTTDIDNRYLTLRPGTTFVYAAPGEGEVVTVTVTHRTHVVDGVTCVVVRDTARVNGQVIEDTRDWYAQDDAGNVWYFGENTRAFEPGNPDGSTDEGSWQAGVDGAEAGVVMLADPEVGVRYRQEFAEGEAEDWAAVVSLDAVVHVPYGSFDGALKTRDVNPLEPSVERKFYVPGVGEVLSVDAEGSRESLVRIIVSGRAGDDVLAGYAGGDRLLGRAGADRLLGLGGNDTLRGGDGDDHLLGGPGFDRLRGGAGDDVLKGGGGGDVFVFGATTDGRADLDVVVDYRADAVDVLAIRGGAASVVAEAQIAGGWELTLAGDGDVIRLIGVEDATGDGSVLDDVIFG
jgi:Ca2+-binding RTX toxin-like protein